MELTANIEELKGIGEKTALLYHKLGIFTLLDLIQYYPRNYETFEEASSINFKRSCIYGFGVLGTALSYRLARMGLTKPAIFKPKALA